jgi:hypothetical protein
MERLSIICIERRQNPMAKTPEKGGKKKKGGKKGKK